MPMTQQRGGPIDDLLLTLADEDCRSVLRYLGSSEHAVATLDELADGVFAQRGPGADREALRITMYHSTLPKLADCGLVDYDERSGTIRYREQPGLERLLALIAELELEDG